MADYQSMANWNNSAPIPASVGQYISPTSSMTQTPNPMPYGMSPVANNQSIVNPALVGPGGDAGGGLFGDLLGRAGNGDFGSLQGWGSVVGGLGSIWGAYNGMQQMKLAKEQFNFSKSMANRNLANQAAVTNQALRDRRSGRRAVFGGNKGTGAQVNGAPV